MSVVGVLAAKSAANTARTEVVRRLIDVVDDDVIEDVVDSWKLYSEEERCQTEVEDGFDELIVAGVVRCADETTEVVEAALVSVEAVLMQLDCRNDLQVASLILISQDTKLEVFCDADAVGIVLVVGEVDVRALDTADDDEALAAEVLLERDETKRALIAAVLAEKEAKSLRLVADEAEEPAESVLDGMLEGLVVRAGGALDIRQ